MLKGVRYVTDTAGEVTAVQISLDEWGALWEDFYDVMVSESRGHEDEVDWDELKAEIGADA